MTHRREVETQAHARHAAGVGLIALGLAEIGLTALFILEAHQISANADRQRQMGATKVNDSSALIYFSSAVLGGLGVGSVTTGAIMALTGSDPELLMRHYHETYQSPP